MINLCKNSTILFQGDSITDGARDRINGDLNHIMGHGYAYYIASTLGGKYPENNFKFINKGVSGDTITHMYARWHEEALVLRPNIISILIGINDTNFGINSNLEKYLHRYENILNILIEETKAALPETEIILCEPFILPVARVKEKWAVWSAEVKKIQKKVCEAVNKYQITLIELQKIFDDAAKKVPADYWIWDGIHPTVAGHYLIANEWLKSVNIEE